MRNRFLGIAVSGVALAALIAAAVSIAGIQPPIDCSAGGQCVGTPGKDFMQGGELEDEMSALGGRDYLRGDKSADLLLGQGGNDVLEGGLGADVMKGGPGNERGVLIKPRGTLPSQFGPGFFGDEGNDKILGGAGEDYLEGEEGRDTMKGGSGNDYIDAINDDTGGTADVLNCGKDFDRYSARALDEVNDNCEKKVPSNPDDPI